MQPTNSAVALDLVRNFHFKIMHIFAVKAMEVLLEIIDHALLAALVMFLDEAVNI